MGRKIEWNPNHKSADEQEKAFVDKYLTWPAEKKWEYLLELSTQGLKKSTTKGQRRIEWR
jgi:hypothetical protein